MSTQEQQSFRWRTVLEVGLISAIIYVVLGGPGLSALVGGTSSSIPERNTPVAKAKIENLVSPRKDIVCPQPQYDIHVFSTKPLVIYIDNFVSATEADHLLNIRY